MGEIDIDRLARTVRVSGESVVLSTKEYELLLALAAEPERVFRKDELLRDVWGFRSLGRTRTLDSHASRLRPGSSPVSVCHAKIGLRQAGTEGRLQASPRSQGVRTGPSGRCRRGWPPGLRRWRGQDEDPGT